MKVLKLVSIMALLVVNSQIFAQESIKGYKVLYGVGTIAEKTIIISRQYEAAGQKFYVGINPDSLETAFYPADSVKFKKVSWKNIQKMFQQTAYFKVMNAAQRKSNVLQNAGIKHACTNDGGVALTVDLCPSEQPLDRIIFTSVVEEFKDFLKPIPIAVCITGKFLLTHKEDIAWLKEMVASQTIAITWVNHSYNHFFDNKLPLDKNFLLKDKTDLNIEVMENEKAMIQNGLTPSVFFRFPGLISNREIVQKIQQYGLIPLGSDAWLAKDEVPKSGSIILIHGNGHEPRGIKDFLQLMQKEKNNIAQRKWEIHDLKKSLAHEYRK